MILALVFVEFFSTVRVVDSNTATAFIECTIYGNISMLPKKKKKERKKRNDCQNKDPNGSVTLAARVLLTAGYRPVGSCLSMHQSQERGARVCTCAFF